MVKKRYWLVRDFIAMSFILITIPLNIYCNKPTLDSSKVKTQLFGNIGMPLALSSTEFFNDYKKYLGGQKDYFTYTALLNVGIKFIYSDWYRIVAKVDYFVSNFSDSYIQEVKESYGAGKRDITQNIKVNSIPVTVGIEFYPISQQFRNYVSAGVGACFGSIEWNEILRTTVENDPRSGGTHFSTNNIYPVIRIGTGIELGFDDKYEKNILSSLLLDVNFSYIFRFVQIYEEVAKQFKDAPTNWSNLYPILPSYLSLSMGISINLYRL